MKFPRLRAARTLLVPCLATMSPLVAATQATAADGDVDELAPVVVTATRTAQTANEMLASVTVITRAEIERKQAHSVIDVLRGAPGVAFTNNGGRGKATSLFLRGAESDHTLVLIDGVKVGSATQGAAALQNIPVEQIERIEIVRGPRSSLYGSEAIGGVIQIFTRRGGGELAPFFSVTAGSYDSYEATAGLSGGGDNAWFNVTLSGLDTDGFNACDGEPGVGGCFAIEPDDDGYSELSGSLRAGYRFADGTEIDGRWLRADGDSEFDGTLQNETETTQQVFGATLRTTPFDPWSLTLNAGRSQDKSDNFMNGVFFSRFDTERDVLSLQNDVSLTPDDLVTVGVDYQNDKVDSTTSYAETSRRNLGVFGQYQTMIGSHDVELSIRGDDNEQFGGHATGSVAWGYSFEDGPRVTASFGTAYKAPTFNELYFPGFGNTNLDPEESRSVEVGVSDRPSWGRWSVALYQTNVDDLISFNAAIMAPDNIAKTRIRGLEVEASTELAGWIVAANLTLLDPENRSPGANQGNDLSRRARRTLRLDLDRDFEDYGVGATLVAVGRRYDDLANTRRLGGYATVDLRGEYRLSSDWRLQARIENLLDKDYETASFYNPSGRAAYLTLRYRYGG